MDEVLRNAKTKRALQQGFELSVSTTKFLSNVLCSALFSRGATSG